MCPVGFYCPNLDPREARPCKLGTFCPGGSVKPTLCPAGYYCPAPNASLPCRDGLYCPEGSTAEDAAECPPNYIPHPTICVAPHCFCVTSVVVAVCAVMIPMVSVVMFILWKVADVRDPATLAWIALATADWGTDMGYLLTTAFRNAALQGFCVLFFLLPGMLVFYVFPLDRRFWEWLSSFGRAEPFIWRRITDPWGERTVRTSRPSANGKGYVLHSSHPHDAELLLVLCNAVYTLVWWLAYAALALVLLGLYPVVGMLLISTKLLAFPPVVAWWESTFHARMRADWAADTIGRKAKSDHRVYNMAVLAEVLLESAPQLVIQLANNTNGAWSALAVMSLVFSLVMVLRYVWLFAYHAIALGTPWHEVPCIHKTKEEENSTRAKEMLPYVSSSDSDYRAL